MTCRAWLSLFFIAAFVLPAFAADRDSADRESADQSNADIAKRLIGEALKPSLLEANLRRLTDEIGGRVPGTPAFQRAVDWAVAAFKDAGAYERAPAIIALAVKGKAKAIAFIATREHQILYRHTNSNAGEIDALPQVVIAREDGERIARLLASGNPVWANLSIPNKIGPAIKTWNVVAEIRGSEKPDEFVILGAHLDSWELGTGALDNGCNAALVIDALRAIKAVDLKPRRSIRFILFSGEEEGLIGSRAYAVAHRKELDNAAGVVIFDSGTGKTTGFSTGGRKDVVPAAQSMLAPLKQFGLTKADATAESGTDHFDFMLEGVPTFVADQEEANYLENYHATTDTFDKVDFVQLKKNVAEAAVFSFALASAADRIGPRLTRVQIEQTLHDTHLDEELKSMGMWDEWANGTRGREQ
jgi:carboxypeptidase Q